MTKYLAIVALLTATAHGESWHEGKYGKNRVTHVVITVGSGAAFALSETVLKPSFASLTCRWCVPDSLDASVRNDVVWQHPSTAVLLSNIEGYAVAPAFAIGMTLAGTLTSHDTSTGAILDDLVPVLETAGLAQMLVQPVKFAVARARPYAYYTPPAKAGLDDNVSFFSGHSTLVFSVATSAGLIAHKRHYWTEPYIWIGGYALAASTAYLRMAGDKHYLTDVLTGSVVGVAAGLTVPLMMDRSRTIEITPTANGMAIAGVF
ncbi:MAG: phosphatase PAP2 family protein [Acidobacteriota bacterium]